MKKVTPELEVRSNEIRIFYFSCNFLKFLMIRFDRIEQVTYQIYPIDLKWKRLSTPVRFGRTES